MIDMLIKLGFILFLPTFFPWLAICIYLSIKLRRYKYQMINAISDCAPDKFKERAKLLMNSNFSWVFASSFVYAWYAYPMLRFAWAISREDIIDWRANIGKLYGEYETLYKIFSNLVNVSMIGFTLLVVSLVLDK